MAPGISLTGVSSPISTPASFVRGQPADNSRVLKGVEPRTPPELGGGHPGIRHQKRDYGIGGASMEH